MKKDLTSREENYSQWYLDVIQAADLADYSPVKGCMVIKPYGFSLWENIQKILDTAFKAEDVDNAYFPLFIPKSFLTREAEHVDGFAKECAVVTHTRLVEKDGDLVTAEESKLEEELIIRPTSETMINSMFSKWIQSYRDLPYKVNQWCNVVRWEMRTRLFLRTAEFLWQEGHTCHESSEEAEEFTLKMLDVYREFVESSLGIALYCGKKSESEKFAGAEDTYCIEAMMQDGKAVQAGTSHFLGQNFAKAFDTSFQGKDGKMHLVWQTSWGVSTRLIGTLIMSHSDDKGLVLTPAIAPFQVVIIPIGKKNVENPELDETTEQLHRNFIKLGIRSKLDKRKHMSPGQKFGEWEKKGVPLRIEIGPRDLANKEAVLKVRYNDEKFSASIDELSDLIPKKLSEIQTAILENNRNRLIENTVEIENWSELSEQLDNSKFVSCYWANDDDAETRLKDELQATVRCIPFKFGSFDYHEVPDGAMSICGKPALSRVIIGRNY